MIDSELKNLKDEIPSNYADRLGVLYTNKVTLEHKKLIGQFFTPAPIAHLMASFCNLTLNRIRILDPGCGTGILTCALVEHLIKVNENIEFIDLVAYETDPDLIVYSEKTLRYLKKVLNEKGIKFQFLLLIDDFILDNSNVISKNKSTREPFDIVICNPPYFKLSKNDKRAQAVKILVSGQPNIYSIFMGVAASLLYEEGQLVFITPRSFASGNYFKAFRIYFFNSVQLERIHLFVSRTDTFNRDSVLQETVILKARKQKIDIDKLFTVSSSTGLNDINQPVIKHFPSKDLIDLESNEKILHLPINDKEESILSLVSAWSNRLTDLNIQISTGPVVAFRAKAYIQNNFENGKVFLAPLFWLHNVNKMFLNWPVNFKDKGQYIRIEKNAKSLLIPNRDYILLRRFSTKDDKSRLIAAPYFRSYTDSEYIGVENKVNYIYRRKGHLNRNEVTGLCAILNSVLFDTYFQMFNGNVNVSATELREMKFPPIEIIQDIGNDIILSNDYSMQNVNYLINSCFELESILK